MPPKDAAGGDPGCRQAGLADALLWDDKGTKDVLCLCIKSLTRNYIYVGLTSNIERRIGEHNKGKNKSTKAYRPFILIFSEQCETRELAREKEKYLKSGVGKEFLKHLI